MEEVIEAYDRFFKNHINPDKMHRLHVSSNLLSLDDFVDHPQKVDSKPMGLWYAHNDSWFDWCKSEMPHWLQPYIYEIVLHTDTIYQISNVNQLKKFEKDYDGTEIFNQQLGIDSKLLMRHWIDYVKLAENYGGIEIIPYLYSHRFQSMWYYGWDCASGCVFKKSSIKEIRFLAEFDPKKKDFVKI